MCNESGILQLYIFVLLALTGAVLGSFLDCMAWRWARGESLTKGRSRCNTCGHVLGVRDLVPIFSWLFHRGRCRFCKAKIPAECLVAELAGAAVYVALGGTIGLVAELGMWLIFAGLLLAVSLTDQEKKIIPDRLLVAAVGNRLLWFLLLGQPLLETGKEILLAACVPFGLLVLVLVADRLMGRETMGGGDIKLLFVMAFYLNWMQMILTLLSGCMLGLAAALFGKKKGGEAIPFGPFLAAGGMIALCFGTPLITWYMSLF